jgi:hypothetical protein
MIPHYSISHKSLLLPFAAALVVDADYVIQYVMCCLNSLTLAVASS